MPADPPLDGDAAIDRLHPCRRQGEPSRDLVCPMKLPYAAHARVDRNKIATYLLSTSHPDGGSKARYFTAFGFRANKWQIFVRALKKHGENCELRSSVESKYGTRYSLDGLLETPDGRE